MSEMVTQENSLFLISLRDHVNSVGNYLKFCIATDFIP